MSYLLDKRVKRNNLVKIVIAIIFVIILIYFRSPVSAGLSFVAHTVFRPVLVLGDSMGDGVRSFGAFFNSKRSLFLDNEDLRFRLGEAEGKISNYNSLLEENLKIKEILNRQNPNSSLVLATILSRPNQSPYDTLIIDVGGSHSLSVGDLVFANGNIPIGRIDSIYPNSAKVTLFSSPGEKTQVLVPIDTGAVNELGEPVAGRDVSVEMVGRGGGNFELILLREVELPQGIEATLPGITPYVVAVAQEIISDPRDSFKKALLVSPVNIQELKFVQVKVR